MYKEIIRDLERLAAVYMDKPEDLEENVRIELEGETFMFEPVPRNENDAGAVSENTRI